MITIKCTESEKRKLCSTESNVICHVCYALGACKEFIGECEKCKRHRSKYVKWEIISKPKKKEAGDASSCCNCYWNDSGTCTDKKSAFYRQPIDTARKILGRKSHCATYAAYEGDG